MDINNFSSDENSLRDDLVESEFLPQQGEIKVFHMNDNQTRKELKNKVVFEEVFEKAFNKVFNPKSKELLEIDDYQEENISLKPEAILENKYIQPYTEEKIIVNMPEKKDKAFPFTKGIGLNETLKSIGLALNKNSSSKIVLSICNNTNPLIMGSTFKTTDYYIDEKGKKKKQKKKRKFKPDDIRKKIKAKFHKTTKNIINSKLKQAGTVKLFDFLPQSFITNVSIKLNNQSLGLTYEEIILKDYSSETFPKADRNKYFNNLEVLNYLKENPKICELSEFNIIKNMKYMDILRAYFSSYEFEQSIIELYNKKEKGEFLSKKEKIEYIENYLNKALTYVNFYNNNKKGYYETTYNNKADSSYDDDEISESES
jgi:hypothetical protein